MKITMQSAMSGNINTLDVAITLEQFSAWVDGALIQEAMPHLTASEREFLLTGITSEEWDETFEDSEDAWYFC
jgi:hypothetical protein